MSAQKIHILLAEDDTNLSFLVKKNLEEEVVKQKETERKLQASYGELLSTLEKAEEIMVGFRVQALKQADVEDSHNLKEAKLATGEEEDVAISTEASS